VRQGVPADTAPAPTWALEAHEPPEARGLARDAVRMLVAERASGRLDHRRARDLPDVLAPGDLVVVNTSATLPAALRARRASGDEVDLHVSVPMAGSAHRLVELRRGGARVRDGRAGEVLELPGGGRAALVAPYLSGTRLWAAALSLPARIEDYLARHGRPIRYRHVPRAWPLSAYQTVYALEPGSSEMPSAGRPLTTGLITALVARGVAVAPVVLHAGVSSPEEGEPPVPEPYRVPPATARLVELTRRGGGRVVAVGTTVVRALETVAETGAGVRAGEGFTRLLVTPARGVQVVDALLTGWHEPDAPHLGMLRAVGGPGLVERSYAAARDAGYLWHEFGDVHLILP
jgi:S-adenosylmethionine:tRNA ribosyltransferase-isomerase